MRKLTDGEKQQVRDEYTQIVGDGQGGAARAFAQRLREHEDHARDAGAVGRADEPEPYRIEFGQHRRKTVAEVATGFGHKQHGSEDDKKQGMDYLAWAVVSKLHHKYPMFEKALRDEGLWEEVAAKAPAKKTDMQEAIVLKSQEQETRIAAGETVHREL
eukprot:5000425-Pyramimonas_sp.AAC.1